MKIYTRTGDTGETGLRGGERVSKDAARLEAIGTVDELNSTLGLARAETPPDDVDQVLRRLQNELFEAGAQLASKAADRPEPGAMSKGGVSVLEGDIDRFSETLKPLEQFILPGGTRAGAALHLARAVCRRAERRLVTLSRMSGEEVAPELLAYCNRLADLLFVLARVANARAGRDDVGWQSG
jgi:cob(I)alamin adenosyltransferase